MNFIQHIQRHQAAYCLALICSLVLVLSTKGIMDESTVSINGDMPKYLMNGAFFHDFIRDFPMSNPLQYAYHYFARYPALSLGHHPLLLGVAEVPFYSMFGISIFSARLTVLFFMLLAAIAWFQLVRLAYNETVACFSTLLFVTTPIIIDLSRIVMSEIPTLSLLFLATYFFYKYCQLEKPKYAYVFALSFVLSVYAKQTAIFMLPVYFCYFLLTKGVKKLFSKEAMISCLIIALFILPLIPITLKFSQYNVAWTKHKVEAIHITNSYRHLQNLNIMRKAAPSVLVLILGAISICVSIYRRDKRSLFFLLWIIIFYGEFTYTGVPTPRHAIYIFPPLLLFSAQTVNLFRHRLSKALLSALLIVIIGHQFAVGFQREPEYTEGYEKAAEYIMDHNKGGCVLYSGAYDTGYFIFFIRKHDPNQKMIVLRADKLLATSRMNRIIEDRIRNSGDIYEILKTYGIRYVLIEDARFRSPSLNWLRKEVKTDKFILRKEIILRSNNPKVNHVPLDIYEFKNYTKPREGSILRMNIPLMGGSITIPFDDLSHSQE